LRSSLESFNLNPENEASADAAAFASAVEATKSKAHFTNVEGK